MPGLLQQAAQGAVAKGNIEVAVKQIIQAAAAGGDVAAIKQSVIVANDAAIDQAILNKDFPKLTDHLKIQVKMGVDDAKIEKVSSDAIASFNHTAITTAIFNNYVNVYSLNATAAAENILTTLNATDVNLANTFAVAANITAPTPTPPALAVKVALDAKDAAGNYMHVFHYKKCSTDELNEYYLPAKDFSKGLVKYHSWTKVSSGGTGLPSSIGSYLDNHETSANARKGEVGYTDCKTLVDHVGPVTGVSEWTLV